MVSVGPSIPCRIETAADEDAVAAVVSAAFDRHPSVRALVAELRSGPTWVDGLSFVADHEGAVIGHVLLSRAFLDAPARLVEVLTLSPLSVAPAHQQRGVGGALVRHALAEVARRAAEPLVFLEGPPAYYARFGFEPATSLGFRRPSLRIPEPALMVCRMPSYEPDMSGTFVYPDVFWRLDCVGLRDG